MSISPFMAGVSGFLQRRREAKDAQALRDHEMMLAGQKATTAANATALAEFAAAPKLYVNKPDGTRFNLLGSDGKEVINRLAQGKIDNSNDLLSFMSVYEDVYKKNYDTLDENQQAQLNGIGATLQSLAKKDEFVNTEQGNIFIPFNHWVLGENFSGNGKNETSLVNNNQVAIKNNNGTFILPKPTDDTADLRKDAQEYAAIIAPHHKTTPAGIETMYSTEELWTAYNLSKTTNFYHEIKSGRLSRETSQYLVDASRWFFPEPKNPKDKTLVDLDRDAFVYDVIRSASRDVLQKNINLPGRPGQTFGLEFYTSGSAYAKDKDINVKGHTEKADSIETALQTAYNMLGLMESYDPEDLKKAMPMGGTGVFMGGIASFFKEGGGKDQISELVNLVKDGLGITYEIGGRKKFEDRLNNFEVDGKKYGSYSELIDGVGNFRAQYEVMLEVFAYQLAAALQGGTGGRTISDQDVINIKRALGNSLFVNKEFQSHRMESIINMLSSTYKAHDAYKNAGTIGDYQTARIYEDYIYGVSLSRNLRNTYNVLQPEDIAPRGQLWVRVAELSGSYFAMADNAHNITNVPNGAHELVDNPPASEDSPPPDSATTTTFGYNFKPETLNREIPVKKSLPDWKGGNLNAFLTFSKNYLDDNGDFKEGVNVGAASIVDSMLKTYSEKGGK